MDPPWPIGSFQVVVEPAEKDLLGGQPQELLQRLILLKKPVKFGVEFDVNLAQKTPPNNLPDQAQDEVFSDLNDITRTDIHDRASYTLGRLDNDIVVFCHVEGIEVFDLASGDVEHTLIDGVRNTIVDELRQYQTVLALIEHLESIGREGQTSPNVGVAGEDSIDMPGELSAFVLVDGVSDIGVRSSDVDLAATSNAPLGSMTTCSL